MKQGTPGFVGTALRQAREARGLSASSLADLLGVTRSAISQYELGIQSPRPTVLERASLTLNLPIDFFLRVCSTDNSFETIFYRSIGPASRAARIKASRRLEWLHEIVAYLTEFVELPSINLPEFGFPADPNRIRESEIEKAAEETRGLFDLHDEPIPNLVRCLENNGIVVARDEVDSESLDSLCAWAKNKRPFVILADHVRAAASARYEAARCLGHLVLHKRVTQAQLASNNDFATLRHQASLFAGAFLLPHDSFMSDLFSISLDAMRIVKQRWKVPIGVMIRRLEQLKVVTAEQAKRLYTGRSRREWVRIEPLDEELPLERPRLLSESIGLIVDEKVQAKQDVLVALPYSDRDVEMLASLDSGYLTDTMPVISMIPAEKRSGRSKGGGSDGGSVVQFPIQKPTPKAEEKKRKFK